VLEGHVEDAWGIGLVTVGILAALGLYGDALGPVGHGLRHGLGMVLGTGGPIWWLFWTGTGLAGLGLLIMIVTNSFEDWY